MIMLRPIPLFLLLFSTTAHIPSRTFCAVRDELGQSQIIPISYPIDPSQRPESFALEYISSVVAPSYPPPPPPSPSSKLIEANKYFFSSIDEKFIPELLAYIDETLHLTNSIRSDVKSYIKATKLPIKIAIDQIDCSPDPTTNLVGAIYLDDADFLHLDFGTFNALLLSDWEYLFTNPRRTIDALKIEPSVSVNMSASVKNILMQHFEQFKTNLNATLKPTAYVVNLDRRQDRLEAMSAILEANEISESFSISRFSAVNGLSLNLASDPIQHLFNLTDWAGAPKSRNPHGNHGYSRAVIGNAMSHVKVWEKLAEDEKMALDEFVLVLEDDVDDFIEGFNQVWGGLKSTLVADQTWEIFFLGTFDETVSIYNDFRVHHFGEIQIKQFSELPRSFGGGSHAYLIRKRAAIFILNHLKTNPITQAIDWFLFGLFNSDEFVCYKAEPNLINSKSIIEDRGRMSESDVGAVGQTTKNNDRLLNLIARKGGKYGEYVEGLSFSVTSPRNGEVIDVTSGSGSGSGGGIKISIETTDSPNLLMQRHVGSLVCARIDDGGEICNTLEESHLLSVDRLVEREKEEGEFLGERVVKVRFVTMFGDVIAESSKKVFFK